MPWNAHRELGTSVWLQQQAAHWAHAWLCQPELLLLRRRKLLKTSLAFGIQASSQSPKLAMYLRVTDSPNPSLRVPGTSSLLLSFRSNWKGEEDAVGSSSTQLLIKRLEIFLGLNGLPACITHLPGGSHIYQAWGKTRLGHCYYYFNSGFT